MVTRLENQVNVYILQHPDEIKNPKGSAIIAQLSLSNAQSWVGEDFSNDERLNALIKQNPKSSFVVYPGDKAIELDQCLKRYPQMPLEQINLIFIDATWRKAEKIWQLSNNLHELPQLVLPDSHQSNYRIRKIPKQGYLSTVEAVVHCLAQLENNSQKYRSLLQVFEKMINFQINKMGDEVYQRNYKE